MFILAAYVDEKILGNCPLTVKTVEQELLILPEHLSLPSVFSGVRVTRSLVLCVCFVDRCLSFFLLAIMLSVLLRYTDSDYHFGIYKLFLMLFDIYLKKYKKGHCRNSSEIQWKKLRKMQNRYPYHTSTRPFTLLV